MLFFYIYIYKSFNKNTFFMHTIKLTPRNVFLQSFDNDVNGRANVIYENNNIILGFIGKFGYAIFELGVSGYFNQVTPFSDFLLAEKEFNDRIGYDYPMSLDSKISLIEDEKIRLFLQSRVLSLRSEIKTSEKWKSIQAHCILDNLSKKSVSQIYQIADNYLKKEQ